MVDFHILHISRKSDSCMIPKNSRQVYILHRVAIARVGLFLLLSLAPAHWLLLSYPCQLFHSVWISTVQVMYSALHPAVMENTPDSI